MTTATRENAADVTAPAVDENILADRQLIIDARRRGKGPLLGAFFKLSGPGWLQAAITLGGGTLASSLYLGVLAGYSMMWLQPIAMILGVIMLSGIGYVTLSTSERPFQAINRHVSPVLGWSWAIASLMANMVWALPQYSLANGVLQQNLAPGLLGGDAGKWIICISILVLTIAITWTYDSGGWGIRLYEWLLKAMVAGVVICFFGVVVAMSMRGDLPWGQILGGFIPDLSRINAPAEGYTALLAQIDEPWRAWWSDYIVFKQRDVMISAAATAVGINMTFLLPYSMLRKRWDREFRGLAIFDLATGLFIPFMIVVSCVVIASASQFHLQPGAFGGTSQTQTAVAPSGKWTNEYNGLVQKRVQAEATASSADVAAVSAQLAPAERQLAAMLADRDVRDLSGALSPLVGNRIANVIFGLGVLGMALSTITILMLISGFVICEMLGIPSKGWPFKIATLAACTGVLGPFLWGKAAAYLAVPTSVFGMALLPIAYLSFWALMNQRKLLGDDMPRGAKRWAWNILMAIAAGAATLASGYVITQKGGVIAWCLVGALLVLAVIVHFVRRSRAAAK